MIKILHAADFHLDSPFRALSPEQARQRRQEVRENVLRLANFANAEQVELVLLSGDLFDSDEIYRETAEMLAHALGSISGRVLIAPGNHDCWDPRGPYGQVEWPENVHIFTQSRLESAEWPEKNLVIHGAAFSAPSQPDGFLAGFSAPEDGKLHMGLLHG